MKKYKDIVNNIPISVNDARHLLAYVLGCDVSCLIANADMPIDHKTDKKFMELVALRKDGVPVDVLLGERGFWKDTFKVTQDVLSPRPDTECIIEQVLHYEKTAEKILDLGTGSGCVLLSLLREYPMAKGVGVDISRAALEVAQLNATAHKMDHRATFICSDWFQHISGAFDIIVCNPPYIPSKDIHSLPTEVREHDPAVALDGGNAGLEAYQTIAQNISRHVKKDTLFVLEFGKGQHCAVKKIFVTKGFIPLDYGVDLAGIIRTCAFRCA